MTNPAPASPISLSQRRMLRDQFLAVLHTAIQERGNRMDTVIAPDGELELAYVAYEREVIAGAVSAELLRRGISDEVVDPERIWQDAETLAIGRSDYASTYALHCAFIVEQAISRVAAADSTAKVTFTILELLNRGAWSPACRMLGLNAGMIMDGVVDMDDRLAFTPAQARELGLADD
jgi:hypothetical protein